MEGSVGKALRAARLSKKLAVEDVARATKMRPERVSDLEKDDYTRFPNLTYARKFLVLYAKYVGVDISNFHTIEVGSTAGVGDYQYLQNESGVDSLRFTENELPRRKPQWIYAFMVFVAALMFGALAGYYVLNFERLGSLDQLKKNDAGDLEALKQPIPADSRLAPSPPSPALAPNAAVDRPSPTSSPALPLAPPSTGTDAPPFQADRPVRHALPLLPAPALPNPLESGSAPSVPMESGSSKIDPAPPASAPDLALPPISEPAPSATPDDRPSHEITVRVTKKMLVKILQDDVKSSPVFEDWLAPSSAKLTFHGKHFWIQTHDSHGRSSVKVTSDGADVNKNSKSVVEFD